MSNISNNNIDICDYYKIGNKMIDLIKCFNKLLYRDKPIFNDFYYSNKNIFDSVFNDLQNLRSDYSLLIKLLELKYNI